MELDERNSKLDITLERLHNQALAEQRFEKPSEVVSWLGVVQAQNYAAAKWALGLRMKNATDNTVEEAFDDGKILRTHVLRPTWHFVAPEDIRPLLELSAPRVKVSLANYDRKLGLTEEMLSRYRREVVDALAGGNFLTREELAACFEKSGMKARGQILGNIIMNLELDGLICSGPRRGRQFTYALLEDRVPKFKRIDRDKVRAKLALRYFSSHGPAQLKDFAWWSGLSVKDASEGLDSVKSELMKEVLDDKAYWYAPAEHAPFQKSSAAFLLSIYDEYIISYKDRGDLGWEGFFEKFLRSGNLVSGLIILDGKIAGSWKRTIRSDCVSISVGLLRRFTTSDKIELDNAIRRYGTFLGLPPSPIIRKIPQKKFSNKRD
jgi:hypothetical protein